jgi:DNA-binding XRE family transcriptional regulator
MENRIRKLRIEAGYEKAVDFARAIGIDPRTLSQIETGRVRLPRTKTLLKIAEVLNTTIDDVLRCQKANKARTTDHKLGRRKQRGGKA